MDFVLQGLIAMFVLLISAVILVGTPTTGTPMTDGTAARSVPAAIAPLATDFRLP